MRADQPVRYSADVKPLFRPRDRQSMLFAFDLWSYADVTANADRILERLSEGEMPCDGAWPPQQVEVVKQWIRTGKNP